MTRLSFTTGVSGIFFPRGGSIHTGEDLTKLNGEQLGAMMRLWWKLAADGVLVLHVSYVSFVLLGLLLILIGGCLKWSWGRNFWFRAAHLLAIAIVVTESWMNIPCPLTVWENALRLRAGLESYNESFVAIWLHRILFFELPPEVFTAAYSLFGAAVLLACLLIPPRLPRRSQELT